MAGQKRSDPHGDTGLQRARGAGPPYAHSRNEAGRRQGLREHLEAVSDLAARGAAAFGGDELARAAGLWHDLGKFHPEFQRYLLESEAGGRARGTGPDHKGAGTILATRLCEPLAFLIAGHHGGLMDASHLQQRAKGWLEDGIALRALELAPDDLRRSPAGLTLPNFVRSPREAELYMRMLFSALVDADFLDTECHFQEGQARARDRSLDLQQLREPFERFHATLPVRDDPVGRVRSDVYSACLEAAQAEPGMFRLTVPTGGGKTLSAMAFALRHAQLHGLRRAVVAVPYTSITEQTAQVYRVAFGSDRSVLEHHSAIDPAGVDDQTETGLWGRLASENWGAPVVVTTTVQLFESLFAQATGRCRKLHRLAKSVIILDEAQALPYRLLDPILDALRCLVGRYGASIVLCTATQPALDDAPGFSGLTDIREIVPDPARLFSALRRVTYELPSRSAAWSWVRAAAEMHGEQSALAIVNTVADAVALFDALDDPDALHLSTRLCGAHRRRVLSEVRRRLAEGDSCRLVSTQVAEAGVDVDFPLVLRSLGPLDRIVQAAGRCNREGRLPAGRVIVFRPAEGGMPPGSYRTAADMTASVLASPGADLHSPELYERYFRRLFGIVNLDEQGIQELREHLRYEEVARLFRMIQDDTESVLVRFDEEASGLLEEARSARRITRDLVRRLQPYMVSLRSSNFDRYRRKGFVEEVREGLFLWLGGYDERRGLTEDHDLLFA